MKMINQLAVQANWNEIAEDETRLLRTLTLAEGATQYLALQQEFEPWLQSTAALFAEERMNAMVLLQIRLAKLNQIRKPSMETLLSALQRLQQRLDKAGVPSMVIGGLAVGIWGEPRLTRDVDVKVLASRDDGGKLIEILKGYTPLHTNVAEAFQRNGVAFFHDELGNRLDLMLADTGFDETALSRARSLEVLPGQNVRVCSAEDLIIYKIISTRSKDRVDVEGIIKRQGNQLDDRYVESWLIQFEQALDDSTLRKEYRRLRKQFR